jgi:hypothetical protein
MNDRDNDAVPAGRSNGHDDGHRAGHRERNGTPEAEFISIPEWSRRVGISAESGYKAARLGHIPGCFGIGRLYRVNWPVFVARAGSDQGRDES